MKGGCSADTFGYRPERPAKCCANCAFSDFTGDCVSCNCIIMQEHDRKRIYEISQVDSKLAYSQTETCGICRRWLSRGIALVARECSSFDEFRLKRDIIDENAHTQELDEWFSERKATEKMEKLVIAMTDVAERSAFESVCVNSQFAGTMSLEFSDFPTMAEVRSITEDGRITEIRSSNAFYSVQHWISENKPAYDEWLERKRKHLQFEWPDVTVSVRPFVNSSAPVFVRTSL